MVLNIAVATSGSRVHEAIQFKSYQDSMFLGIGRAQAWNNEKMPPRDNEKQTTIQEPIGYKKVGKVSLARRVKESEEPSYPTVNYGDQEFVLVPEKEGYKEQADLVYIETDILGDDFPSGEYRQIGLHVGMVPKEENKKILLPEDVKESGTLMVVENRQRQNRTPDIQVKEILILSFDPIA